MKTVFVFFALIAVSFQPLNAQEVHWKSIEEAQQLNQNAKTQHWLIVDVYTPWCGPCKMMERGTFSDASVIEYLNANYHAVKFNGEGPKDATFNGKLYSNPGYDATRGNGRNAMHQLTQFFKVPGYPTLMIIDEKGEIVTQLVGYKTPEQLIEALEALPK